MEEIHNKVHILGSSFTTGLIAGAEPFANMLGAVAALFVLEGAKHLLQLYKDYRNAK